MRGRLLLISPLVRAVLYTSPSRKEVPRSLKISYALSEAVLPLERRTLGVSAVGWHTWPQERWPHACSPRRARDCVPPQACRTQTHCDTGSLLRLLSFAHVLLSTSQAWKRLQAHPFPIVVTVELVALRFSKGAGSQEPDAMGKQVHQSAWVAFCAVVRLVRDRPSLAPWPPDCCRAQKGRAADVPPRAGARSMPQLHWPRASASASTSSLPSSKPSLLSLPSSPPSSPPIGSSHFYVAIVWKLSGRKPRMSPHKAPLPALHEAGDQYPKVVVQIPTVQRARGEIRASEHERSAPPMFNERENNRDGRDFSASARCLAEALKSHLPCMFNERAKSPCSASLSLNILARYDMSPPGDGPIAKSFSTALLDCAKFCALPS